MKNKKAILVWSDGIETNYTEYTSTPDKTAVEQAQDQMHKEYQEHGEADAECGAFEGDMECYFAAEDQDSCRWTIIPVSEDEENNDYRFIATDIEWDTDGDQEILDLLPKRVILPEEFCIDDYLDTERLLDDVSDWLSAEYEYCHSGFRLNHNKDVSNSKSLRKLEDNDMNRYSLRFDWKFNGESDYWEMVVLSDDSKEYVAEVIKNYQKNNNVEFESPVELMDAICDEYGWQWEDFYHDIEIEF